MSRILTFYQTAADNAWDMATSAYVTDIHLAAVHFGHTDGEPYIHLNDLPPTDPSFNSLWETMNIARCSGKRVSAMVGGEGGGVKALFADYSTFYPMLLDFLTTHYCLSGVNLDVERGGVSLPDIVRLITDLRKDLPSSFSLSMAPVADSLIMDGPGMGGFSYKALDKALSDGGVRPPDYYTVQCYGPSMSAAVYSSIVTAGWDSRRIVFVGLAPLDPSVMGSQVTKAVSALPPGAVFGGAGIWEWETENPHALLWCETVWRAMQPPSPYWITSILFDLLSAIYQALP